MALAITPFQALCGFRPLPEIAAYLNSTPELKSLLPPPIVDEFLKISNSTTPAGPEEKAALKNLFASLMMADETAIKTKSGALVARYKSGEAYHGEDPDVVKLVLTLDKQFPGDIGIFCAYVLNYVHLRPGEAIFLGAGEPHAYVSGGSSCYLSDHGSSNVPSQNASNAWPILIMSSALVSPLSCAIYPISFLDSHTTPPLHLTTSLTPSDSGMRHRLRLSTTLPYLNSQSSGSSYPQKVTRKKTRRFTHLLEAPVS